MIKIQKIRYSNGYYLLFKIFDTPVLQYIKTHNKKVRIKFPFLRRQNKQPLMFYLKYNSPNFHSIWCLHKWIETIADLGGRYVIVCDNQKLEEKIIANTTFNDDYYKFIKSDRRTLKHIIKNICDKTWINAGFSHLTTFTHAKANNIEEFWNIDVDDTTFFETPQKIADSLKKVMEYSKINNLDVFSYDMHASRFNNRHWSFGVTYTRNNSKLVEIIKNAKTKDWQRNYFDLQKLFGDFNLDWYFTYLKDNKLINAKTFNINNLYFAHWGFATPTALTRLIQVEYNNKLYFPLSNSLCTLDFMQAIQLKDEIVVFETGINKDESLKFLTGMLCSYERKLNNVTDK